MAPTRHSLAVSPEDPAIEEPARARQLRRDAEANRQQILDAAGRLMAERGLATPLEDIAAAAGVGIATLYRRFPTRSDLVEALFQDRVATYLSDLETALAMNDGWEALCWALQRSVSRQVADKALHELLEQDPGTSTVRQLLERIWPLAEKLVRKAKATGRLRDDFAVSDLTLVQHMLVAVATTVSALDDAAWQRYLTIVLDGLVTARSRPTPQVRPALTAGQFEALHAAQPPRRR